MIDKETLDKLIDAYCDAMPFAPEYNESKSEEEQDRRAAANGEFFMLSYKTFPEILKTIQEAKHLAQLLSND